jgi:hypothetical protein
MKAIRARLSYANVVATLALVLALGGVSWAATKLPKNSVGTKQIKNNAVTGAKVKKHTLTGKDINLNKLGTVPSAKNATSATTASSLTPPEAVRLVGAAGQPQFLDGTVNFPPEQGVSFHPVGFYKDHEGIVHLEGIAIAGKSGGSGITPIFNLPAGFRPQAGLNIFSGFAESATFIAGTSVSFETLALNGGDVAAPEEELVVLSGVSFRAAN